MRVITTKPDFWDFQQMVEYYNKNNKNHIQIHATPGTALSDVDGYLPDMNQVYENVRNYGLQATKVLDELRGTFTDIPQDKEAIRQSIMNFDGEVRQEIERIKERGNSLNDNNVNLCFAGVYSTGKSALINALLGYRILPESSDSKTARMFRIRSPKGPEDPISITFKIIGDTASLAWQNGRFVLVQEPLENDSVKRIRDQLDEFKKGDQTPKRHEQICKLLELLNSDHDISTDIEITFPIPLDTENVQFTIFDTPGTDSNYEDHQQTLIEALSEQTNSILVFVAAPDKMEGTGNQKLFEFINSAKNSGFASIDISRSLFVINKADTVGPEDRESKHNAQIINTPKKDESDEDNRAENIASGKSADLIELSDKKLFFVSAKVAYAAKAEKNKISTYVDSDAFETAIIQQESNRRAEMHRYYKQNKCARSCFATDQMIAQCDTAMAEAQAANDKFEIVHISSGLYALERAIVEYGEKYAAAVRAYAMIDGVDKALAALQRTASALTSENEENLRQITQEIEDIRQNITHSINMALEKYRLPKGQIPVEQIEHLKMDDQTFKDIEKSVVRTIKGRLRSIFPRSEEKKKQRIKSDIDTILNNWSGSYVSGRNKLLTDMRDRAIADARKTIEANGKVYPGAVQYVCQIQPPKLEPANVSIARLYDISQSPRDFLWMHIKSLDTKKFVTAVKEELKRYRTEQAKTFRNDYLASFNNVLLAVQQEFETNLEKYSNIIRAKLEDKKSVEALYVQVVAAAEKLEELRQDLDRIIWKVQADD